MSTQNPYLPPEVPDTSYSAWQMANGKEIKSGDLSRLFGPFMNPYYHSWRDRMLNQYQVDLQAYNENYNQYQNEYDKKSEAGLNPYWTDSTPSASGVPTSTESSLPPISPMDYIGGLVNTALSFISGVGDINLKQAQAKKTNAEANFISQSTPARLDILGESYRNKWLGNNAEHWSQFGDSPNMLMTPGFYGGIMPGTYYDSALKGRLLQNTLLKQDADINALPVAVRSRALKMIQEKTLNELGLLSVEQFKKSMEYDVQKLKSDIGFYKTEKVLGVVRSATGSISDLFSGVGNGIGGFLKGLKTGPTRVSNTRYQYGDHYYDINR